MKNYEIKERWQWVSYSTQFESFLFFSLMKRPSFNASVLLKPFTSTLWLSLIACGFALICVTNMVYTNIVHWAPRPDVHKSKISIWYMCVVILATILDQTVAFKRYFSKFFNLYSRKITLVIWVFWVMTAIHLGMLYKAKIFSFMAKEMDPPWPKTIYQLVNMPFSFVTLQDEIAGFHYRRSMLNGTVLRVDENSDLSLRTAYDKLAAQIQFYNESFTQFALDMHVQYNSNNQSRTTNVAIIDKSTLINLEYLMNINFMPNKAISKLNNFPGYLHVTPWDVRNTYFLAIFERFLAKLYESGIERKMYSFLLSAMYYSELSLILMQIKKLYEEEVVNPSKAQLLFTSFKGANFDNSSRENSTVPLSLEMLQTVFTICLCMLMISALVFIYEMLETRSSKCHFRFQCT